MPKTSRARQARKIQLRNEARKAAARSRRQRQRLLVGAVAAVVALVVAVIAFVVAWGGADRTTSTGGDLSGVQTFQVQGRNHVNSAVRYPQTPPVGGNHNPVWQNCGAYDGPVANENAVHSLEHGAVWINYRPDLPADQVQAIREQAEQPFVLVSPFPGLPAPVVASAWGTQLRLDSAADARLAEFVGAYRQGPQTPEPGAPCTGGAGTPR